MKYCLYFIRNNKRTKSVRLLGWVSAGNSFVSRIISLKTPFLGRTKWGGRLQKLVYRWAGGTPGFGARDIKCGK